MKGTSEVYYTVELGAEHRYICRQAGRPISPTLDHDHVSSTSFWRFGSSVLDLYQIAVLRENRVRH